MSTVFENTTLDKVPKEFLTRETMTASVPYSGGNWRGIAGGSCRTETPLHVAVRCGYADQIPKEFLTPEFLSIEAGGFWETVFHGNELGLCGSRSGFCGSSLGFRGRGQISVFHPGSICG